MSIAEAWQPTFVGEGQIRYFSLARHALIEALRLIGVRHGSRVLLPEYLCRDLLAPLNLLGAVPCWYAVTPDLEPATPDGDWPESDVVLAVNYFGFPQDLRPFRAYAARTEATIIEDNAHGYLSRDGTGQWLGCRTELGLFSLRKTLRIPDGAALWVSASNTYELPVQTAFNSAGFSSAQLIKARLRGLPMVGKLAYQLSTALVRALRKWRTGSAVPSPDPGSEQLVPASRNPWAGLKPALSSCAESTEIERRRAAYKRCALVGSQIGVAPIFAELPLYCAPYAYAFRSDAHALKEMRRHAAREGFDLTSWPDLPSEIVGRAPEHYRNVFLVNFLW